MGMISGLFCYFEPKANRISRCGENCRLKFHFKAKIMTKKEIMLHLTTQYEGKC